MQQLRAAREPLARKLLEAQEPAAKQRRFPFLLNLFIRVRHQGWGGLFFLNQGSSIVTKALLH